VGPTRKDAVAVNLYHDLLTWDIMKRPWITRFLDYLLNPILGKSLVVYLSKAEEKTEGQKLRGYQVPGVRNWSNRWR
jgi:hypothetical protein